MNQCPRCGACEQYAIATFGQVEPVGYICESGHRFAPPVRFGRWRGDPVHYMARVRPLVATFSSASDIPELQEDPFEVRTVHCGPHADLPRVPTAGDILRSAGLDHLRPDLVDTPE